MRTTMDGSEEPLFIDTDMNAVRPDMPFVERDAITAVVYDPKTERYLGLKWKKVDWDTLITGGIEKGQTAEEAARAEIREETGYTDLRMVRELPRMHSQFFHHPKGDNRFAHFQCFLFELASDAREGISEEEQGNHDPVWLTKEQMDAFRLPEAQRFIIDEVYSLNK